MFVLKITQGHFCKSHTSPQEQTKEYHETKAKHVIEEVNN